MLKRRNEVDLEEITKDVEDSVDEGFDSFDSNGLSGGSTNIRFNKVISTGSTLLDLIISGSKIRGGGIPGGIIVEFFGKPGCGKTAILEEMGGSIMRRGGEIDYLDPEARLDLDYAREAYDLHLLQENYRRPNTVEEMFSLIWERKWKANEVINGILADSLAALSTDMEMDDRDKMGQRRAKMFSEGLRKTCRLIANQNIIIACSNQVRDGENGFVTPGGHAIPFYSSLRIKMTPTFTGGSKIEHKEKLDNGKEIERIIGVRSTCEVVKSSIDVPYRKCNISILFQRGIDDIRDNLMYRKEILGDTTYDVFKDKGIKGIEKAIQYIEDNNLELELREKTIDLWESVEAKFADTRKRKVRF